MSLIVLPNKAVVKWGDFNGTSAGGLSMDFVYSIIKPDGTMLDANVPYYFGNVPVAYTDIALTIKTKIVTAMLLASGEITLNTVFLW